MPKPDRLLPARKRRDDESLLIRSAESVGRMIGLLQRQLSGPMPAAARSNGNPGQANGRPAHASETVRRGAAAAPRMKRVKNGSKPDAARVRTSEQSKTGRAAKTSGAKAPAGRKRSGTRKSVARKSTRGG